MLHSLCFPVDIHSGYLSGCQINRTRFSQNSTIRGQTTTTMSVSPSVDVVVLPGRAPSGHHKILPSILNLSWTTKAICNQKLRGDEDVGEEDRRKSFSSGIKYVRCELNRYKLTANRERPAFVDCWTAGGTTSSEWKSWQKCNCSKFNWNREINAF